MTIQEMRSIIAEHFGVPIHKVEWVSFKKEGWHVDPPGRFYVDGRGLKTKEVVEILNEAKQIQDE